MRLGPVGQRLLERAQAGGPPGDLPAELAAQVDAAADEELLSAGRHLLARGCVAVRASRLDLAIHLLDVVSALVGHRPALGPGLLVGGRRLQVMLARAQGEIDLQRGLWRLLSTGGADDPLAFLSQVCQLREAWIPEIGELRAQRLAGILAGADPAVRRSWIDEDPWLLSPESDALLARAEAGADAPLGPRLGWLRRLLSPASGPGPG